MKNKENTVYWSEVINSLKNQIPKDGRGYRVEEDYCYSIMSNDSPDQVVLRKYRFDLVELAGERIQIVYEICGPDDVVNNTNLLLKQLRFYQKLTKADVYLAYVNKSDQLQLKALEDFEKENDTKREAVKSFSDFYDVIKELMGRNNSGRTRRCFFRGQPNNSYEPVPIIYRKGNIVKEDQFFREAVRRLPSEFTGDMTTFDKLVKMQEYGLPTRLLDVTTNPLVALYFACLEDGQNVDSKADGEVLMFCMSPDQIHYYDSDDVCVLANLAKQPVDFEYRKKKESLAYDIQKDNPVYSKEFITYNAVNKTICVLPKFNNDRIVMLDGAFFIFGMGETKYEASVFSEPPFIINISADAKKNILEDLELFGINESLYPETDKIIHQIKRELQYDNNYLSPLC